MAYNIGLKIGIDGEAEFRKSINSINEEYKTLKTEMAAVTSEFEKNNKSEENLTKQNEVLTKQIDLQKKKIEECNTALDKAREKYGENDRVTQSWQRTVNATTADLNKLERQLETNNIELAAQGNAFTALSAKFDATGEKLTSLSEGFTKSGKTLTVGVTVPLVALGAAAINTGMDFESSMSAVQAISGATGDDFEKLNQLALQLGKDTAFSAQQAAEGMQNLASAGFNTKEIISAMPGMLDLAAAGGLDVASASDIASSALRAFGLDAGQSGHLADVFAEAAGETNANVTDMGEALKYAATPAYALGMNVEETSAAIGELANVGIKGSEAGTSLRGALISLASPSDTAAEAMQSIGFSAFDAQGQMLPFKEVIGNLQTSLGGLSQEEKTNAVATIFGREAMSGMLALVNAGPEQYSNLTKSLETCDGAASDMAKTMQDNAKSSIEQMMGSLETAAIKTEEAVAPAIRDIAEKVGNLADEFSDLNPETKKAIVVAAGLTAALGPAALAIGGVVKVAAGATVAIKTVIGAIDVLALGAEAATPAIAGTATVLSALTGPVGIIIGAVTLLTAAGVGLHEVYSKNRKLTDEQVEANKEFVASQNAVIDSVENNLTKRTASLKSSEDSAVAAKTLADKIYDLADKQNKSAWEMQVLNGYVKEFNSIMPGANLVIDEQTGALNESRQATDDLIASKTEQIRIEAITQELTQNAKDQLETTRALNDAQAQQSTIMNDYANGLQEIDAGAGDRAEKQQKANELWDVCNQRMMPVNQSMSDLAEKQSKLNTESAALNGLLADPSGWAAYNSNTATAGTATTVFANGTTKTWTDLGTSAPILAKITGENTTAALSDSLTAGTPGVDAAAENMHRAVTQTTNPLPSELSATGSGAAASLGASINGGVPQIGMSANSIYNAITGATNPLPGELGATGLNSVTTMGGGIDIGAPVVNAASQGIFSVITGVLNPLGQFGQDTGASVNAGLRQGMEDHEEIDRSVGGIVQWVLDAFNIGFDIHSPAKKMRPIGVNVLKGLFEGANSLDIAGFADSLVQRLLDAFNNGRVSAMSLFNSMGQEGASLLERMGINLGISGGNLPVDGTISSYFGYRDDVGDVGSSDHMGVDIAAAEGTPIYAAEGGTVSESSGSGYGNLIIIDTGTGLQEYYGHMSGFNVADGATVKKGDLIGFVGSTGNSTGPHLHFGVLKDGEWVDPLAYYGGYATGTDYASPGLHWVGEHGRELVSFGGGEKVYTNEESMKIAEQAAAKQPVTINLVLQNGTKLAEYMIDDINNLLGVKTGLAGRGMA